MNMFDGELTDMVLRTLKASFLQAFFNESLDESFFKNIPFHLNKILPYILWFPLQTA